MAYGKTKNATAVFIGEQGSIGLNTNQRYKLMVSVMGNGLILVRIETQFGSCRTTYESIVSFLNNWDNINLTK